MPQELDKFDLFISYSHRDSREVDQFVNIMEAFGYVIWRDTKDITVGSSIRARIAEGQDATRVYCFWVTRHWKASRVCQDEFDRVYSMGRLIINVVVGDAGAPSLHEFRKYIHHEGDLPETCYLVHRELRASSSDRARQHLEEIRAQRDVETSAHALQRMITLYDSDPALTALIGALESDHLNETNLDYCFRYFRIAFEHCPDDKLIARAKRALNSALHGSNPVAIDKAAYVIGELYLKAVSQELRGWSKRTIRRLAKDPGLVGVKMTYTKQRLQI